MALLTVRDAVARWTQPDALAASDEALRGLVVDEQPSPWPGLEDLRRCPPGSLGSTYAAFLDHYQLPADFFPLLPAWGGAGPTFKAARRLQRIHDLIHLVGAYETSDEDECRLHAFTCGQVPSAFAVFMRGSLAAPEVVHPRYKHLRDVGEGVLPAEDIARGSAAGLLVGFPFERHFRTPLAEVREALRAGPRAAVPACHENTCQGIERPFFDGGR